MNVAQQIYFSRSFCKSIICLCFSVTTGIAHKNEFIVSNHGRKAKGLLFLKADSTLDLWKLLQWRVGIDIDEASRICGSRYPPAGCLHPDWHCWKPLRFITTAIHSSQMVLINSLVHYSFWRASSAQFQRWLCLLVCVGNYQRCCQTKTRSDCHQDALYGTSALKIVLIMRSESLHFWSSFPTCLHLVTT